MRIVGGEFRGRTLKAPAGRETRPTTDRVREAVFNLLAHGVGAVHFDGIRVLDLYAGSGALGLEAMSRGAGFALFVEEASDARGMIRANAEGLGLTGRCKIWRRDATRLGPCAPLPPFDLVFADPPYGEGLGERTLVSLADGGWLANRAVVVLEERAGSAVDLPPGILELDRRTYGDSQIMLLGPEAG